MDQPGSTEIGESLHAEARILNRPDGRPIGPRLGLEVECIEVVEGLVEEPPPKQKMGPNAAKCKPEVTSGAVEPFTARPRGSKGVG
jgi:hypothetical protein